MVGLYLVAAVVTIVAVPPALALGGATHVRAGGDERILTGDGSPEPDLIL
jgi:hypothetical protein